MGDICYSLKEASNNYAGFMAYTRRESAVEIRLDSCLLDDDQLKELFSSQRHSKLIATCHLSGDMGLEDATELLTLAILSGADYVDIPLDYPQNTRKWLINLALNKNCGVIISYHNNSSTDKLETLEAIAQSAFYEGADIVKIVTTASCEEEADRVLKLYEKFPPAKLVAFAMGASGEDSRLESFARGAPLFYLSPTRKGATAPGQPQYFDFLEKGDVVLKGTVDELPSSKSCAQRAILLAALTTGVTKLYNLTLCDDIRSAMGVAESLFADVFLEEGTLTIEGHQNIIKDGLKVRDGHIFVGESALLARLCIPLCGLSREPVVIDGEKSLLSRKVDDHRTILRKAGLKIEYTEKSFLPVTVGGALHSVCAAVDGGKGSQMISGLLIALSQCQQKSFLSINNVTSCPYLDLTTDIASFFGLSDFKRTEEGNRDNEEEAEEDAPEFFHRSYLVGPSQKVTPVLGLEIERDWSSAAMLMAAGALMGDITIKGLDLFSAQADAVMLPLMENCNIDVITENGAVNVRKSILCPFYYDITDSPDLFAPLFLLATCAEGESVIGGIKRLKNKESDRARTFSKEFAKLGVESHIEGDEIFIYGRENRRFKGAECSACGDHRLAMALYLASLMSDNEIHIDNLDSVAKSFPNFVRTVDKLRQK